MGRCFAGILLAVWLLGMTVASSSRAQPVEAARIVLFVLPDAADPEVAKTVVEALEAQFAGQQVELQLARFDVRGSQLRDQVDRARALAESSGAIGVFWVDPFVENDWLLYLVEPEARRVLVRRIVIDDESSGAAAEAVALIAEHSATALVQGSTIGMKPVTLEVESEPVPDLSPPPPPPPPPAPEILAGVRVTAGYRGTTFAEEIPWQNGVDLSMGWISEPGAYGTFAFVLLPKEEVTHQAATFSLTRRPIELAPGWRFRFRRFSFDAEVALALDFTKRHLLTRAPRVAGSPDSRRAVVSAIPRIRGEYWPARAISVYAATGIELAMNNFAFVALLDGQETPLLSPRDVRLGVAVGVAVWP